MAEVYLSQNADGCSMRQGYKYRSSEDIPWSLYHHNAVCQDVLLDVIGSRPSCQDYQTTFELFGDKGEAIPDFSFWENGKEVFCEIELNQKSTERMKLWLGLRIQKLMENSNINFSICAHTLGSLQLISNLLDEGFYFKEPDSFGEGFTYKPNPQIKSRILLGLLCPDSSRMTGGFKVPNFETDYGLL